MTHALDKDVGTRVHDGDTRQSLSYWPYTPAELLPEACVERSMPAASAAASASSCEVLGGGWSGNKNKRRKQGSVTTVSGGEAVLSHGGGTSAIVTRCDAQTGSCAILSAATTQTIAAGGGKEAKCSDHADADQNLVLHAADDDEGMRGGGGGGTYTSYSYSTMPTAAAATAAEAEAEDTLHGAGAAIAQELFGGGSRGRGGMAGFSFTALPQIIAAVQAVERHTVPRGVAQHTKGRCVTLLRTGARIRALCRSVCAAFEDAAIPPIKTSSIRISKSVLQGFQHFLQDPRVRTIRRVLEKLYSAYETRLKAIALLQVCAYALSKKYPKQRRLVRLLMCFIVPDWKRTINFIHNACAA